jgi:hypothetical protein
MKTISKGPFAVELHPAKTKKCDCCDKLNHSLLRFVTRDGDAYAIYRAFMSSHYGLPVHVMATFGEFGDDSSSEDRFSIAFEIWTDTENVCTTVNDPEASPWQDIEGRKLCREDALQFMQNSDFELSTLISNFDPLIVAYLQGRAYKEGIVGRLKNLIQRNARS